MSSNNSINPKYGASFLNNELNPVAKEPVVLGVKTIFGDVFYIKNERQLANFIFNEKALMDSPQGKEFNYSLMHSYDGFLQKINHLYLEKLELTRVDVDQGQSAHQVPQSPPAFIQVLGGKDCCYIGVCTSDEIVDAAHLAFIKDTPIQKEQIHKPTQPHITIVPPSSKITPSLPLENGGSFPPFDVEFEKISVSKRGNINLWGNESNEKYHELSSFVSDAVGGDSNSREAHSKVGVLSKEVTGQIFEDPEKFGFSKDKSGDEDRVYKNINPPLKQTIQFPKEPFPDEQIILKTQTEGATPVTNEEIDANKDIFKEREAQVKNMQKEIKKMTYSERKNNNNNNTVFSWNKLALAIEGEPKVGRVPLTFSCRENGIQLWSEFCSDVKGVVENSGYDDIKVQILGSGVHGFSRNPTKELKGWGYSSDGDLAIFSTKLSADCARKGVQVNEALQLNGKFTCYKNEKYIGKEGIGFHDTPLGQKFQSLENKWSEKLYGKERSTGTDLDFKLNISPVPFKDAITI